LLLATWTAYPLPMTVLQCTAFGGADSEKTLTCRHSGRLDKSGQVAWMQQWSMPGLCVSKVDSCSRWSRCEPVYHAPGKRHALNRHPRFRRTPTPPAGHPHDAAQQSVDTSNVTSRHWSGWMLSTSPALHWLMVWLEGFPMPTSHAGHHEGGTSSSSSSTRLDDTSDAVPDKQ
jgi:hypothetical protein